MTLPKVFLVWEFFTNSLRNCRFLSFREREFTVKNNHDLITLNLCFLIFMFKVTDPLDIVKTRLQIQGELIQNDTSINNTTKKLRKHGMLGTAMNMGTNICAERFFEISIY